MKKSHKIALLIVGIVAFAWFAKIFPDPNGEGAITLVEWIRRELDEWIHGDKTDGDECQ